MKLLHVVGARPNFMKVAPVWRALAGRIDCVQLLVHTGQHYDVNMSDVFFTDLGLPQPDFFLGVGSGSHAKQTAAVMIAFEDVVARVAPDWVLVYGDVNSTVAATLVCAKLQIAVAHVEAGLRSFDRTMPEELNRLVTDQLADLLFTPSEDGDHNLLREGIAPERIKRVGNVMIDTLVRLLPVAERSTILDRLSLQPRTYAVLTLHRPSNVDNAATLSKLLCTFTNLSLELPIVFPVHPRTRQRIAALGQGVKSPRLLLCDPVGYVDFLRLQSQARIILTDSGGIQEEATYLGIPCLTMRSNTERPVTIDLGTNELVGSDLGLLIERFHAILDSDVHWDKHPTASIPLWDGHAAERIAEIILSSGRARAA